MTDRRTRGKMIEDLLVNWYDSGLSNFWIEIVDKRPYVFDPRPGDDLNVKVRLPIKIQCADEPLSGGGVNYTLTLAKCKHALTLMREKFPRHWADVCEENDDANTADLFVQLALFGDEIFS